MLQLKKLIAVALALLLAMLTACSAKNYGESYDMENQRVINGEIVIKDMGTIKIELYPDIAPITVQNFVDLAKSGFYEGIIFHRVIAGFMIQGGDPDGNGTGGSGKYIKGEFRENGVDNPLSHMRGVLSMARRSYPYDSASSQFFIMHADGTYLDGSYAAFGRVTDGMDVVDAIAATPTDGNDKPLTDIVIERIEIFE